MTLRIRAAASAALVGALVLGAPLAAHAETTSYVGGGKWVYGVYEPAGTTFVYSKFWHSGKYHRATACSRGNDCVKTGFVRPGTTARAEKVASMWGNQAFWSTL